MSTIESLDSVIYGVAPSRVSENEYTRLINQPFTYLSEIKGKKLRNMLIEAFNNVIHVSNDTPDDLPTKLEVIMDVVDILHTASLLIDDIEDYTDIRRGKPSAHTVYGIPLTINSGNFMYFRAVDLVRRFLTPESIEIIVKELENFHLGQGMELYWRDTFTCPTEIQYFRMALNKTSGLFRLAVRLMLHNVIDTEKLIAEQLERQTKLERFVVPLANLLGVIYQVRDDYVNLKSLTYASESKGQLGEDITEGKFSFPMIHCLQTLHAIDPIQYQYLINILKERTSDVVKKEQFIKVLEDHGSFKYTSDKLAEFRSKALNMLWELKSNGFDGSEALEAVVLQLSEVVD
ncbi:hypothetical protein BABINDRAFT_163802 [Babjeviella inositovora NRRL Y-12698]|uniref:Geranylgeranyl pyrophosphate synthase n=1 Tax=Babjeviella inositovora NRRL Y-12698 TaxID=984486 RepID=A0A1E3QHI7_9ASCO|nr:uncharacterized protein BABINDRAFT_163802 [Babjeviella inositovora NRRL Y-12698]ODQ77068.1 hypothetical protein BABINDRAFT_163802 [Babjeviella inositovora NRRL Y-12698]